ncbi:MAG TPA: hypothetical protein VL137_09750 [Polyangiaceae bacterium]|nr:hypothetical protein [Polyangiaceae bacterium]
MRLTSFLFASALVGLLFTACSDSGGPVYPLVSEADASHPSHGLPDGGHVIIHLPRPDAGASTPDAQGPDTDATADAAISSDAAPSADATVAPSDASLADAHD